MKTTTSSLMTTGKTTTQQYSEQEKPYPYTRKSRIQRACEKCRQNKTRCDGTLPCKKCKDHNYMCVTSRPNTTKYKQVPAGYAEALENSQLTLVNTIHELYSMVRNGKSWDLGEPEINDQGRPLVHNIATLLGCVRPGSPLSVHTPLPQDETGLAELGAERQARQTNLQVAGEIQQETDGAWNVLERTAPLRIPDLYFEQTNRFVVANRVTNGSLSQGSISCVDHSGLTTSTELQLLNPPSLFNPADMGGSMPCNRAWASPTDGLLLPQLPQINFGNTSQQHHHGVSEWPYIVNGVFRQGDS
ncbi:hypothetical protein BKA67DRAFT_570465 [Truncatella angustata]|uniref:Zn(2)-C6 fungal-type domain-containing protein n=1 Tax=Truncatella angustata TaxID=152316 RepID=A0A9P8UK71_9PEZI|nr:uncharacterized protein BKA67DRAFT_570465 [Truncatella angustata]KAH6653594.1 hypothetical protein BKA67DRAFT_570465 [Truncatella angustata]